MLQFCRSNAFDLELGVCDALRGVDNFRSFFAIANDARKRRYARLFFSREGGGNREAVDR
jgi:hypothetical protein